jgi:hypothetical protein
MTEVKLLRTCRVFFVCFELNRYLSEKNLLGDYWAKFQRLQKEIIVGFLGVVDKKMPKAELREISSEIHTIVDDLPAIPKVHSLFYMQIDRVSSDYECRIPVYLAVSVAAKVFNLTTFM